MTVRVRFAPSPTGHIHIGNVRAALFNDVFARKHSGTFVLRFEDTDLERSSEASAQSIIEDLTWLGLNWQEGPDKGGPYGPYRQMERLETYRRYARQLLDEGKAFYCFCAGNEAPGPGDGGYNRAAGCPCAALAAEEVEARRGAGEEPAVRFKAGGERVRFRDEIFGDLEQEVEDFIILKSNGIPTYHFGVVCDDHEMAITHVIRGQDHKDNTAKHVLLFAAFGWEPPKYAHYSLTFGLSKRDRSVSIANLRERGVPPLAILNMAMLLGWRPPDEQEHFNPFDMTEQFELGNLSKANSNFDPDKFRWLCRQYLAAMPLEELATQAGPFLADLVEPDGLEPGRLKALLELVRERGELAELAGLPELARPYLAAGLELDEAARQAVELEGAVAVLQALKRRLEEASAPLTAEEAGPWVKEIQQETGVKGKGLYFPLRAALTGNPKGPDIGLILFLMGRERAQERVERALAVQTEAGE